MTVCLEPYIPCHDDELSQGFFARLGSIHAGVSASRFCSFVDTDRTAFRNGSDQFIDLMAQLSGVAREKISYNTIKLLDDGSFLLRGEILAMSVLRRTQVQYCPECVRTDSNEIGPEGAGHFRQRWIWQLRPVVSCPIHCVTMTTVDARYGVDAFDLEKLIEPSGIRTEGALMSLPHPPGVTQNYVVNRMDGVSNQSPWLDGQGIADGVRACEMIGSLLVDGPQAAIKDYTATDWAAVGDAGFEVCSKGAEAIRSALRTVRINSGRTSGRTGPQAVFGHLYNSIKKSEREGGLGPIVDVVRDAIVENFAIGVGETVLGKVVPERKVHSVNSLTRATKTHKYRLYRLARTMGMIPETADQAAFNQWVFPAEEAERLIEKIENSIPQNLVMKFLGCTITQVEHLVRNDFIRSITPISEGQVGQMRGNFNRDDLNGFLECICRNLSVVSTETDGYISLSGASRMRTDTGQVMGWFLDGKLSKTYLLRGVQRLDHLRFCHAEVTGQIDEAQDHDYHRLFSVSLMLGASLTAIKRLTSRENGAPLLALVDPEKCKNLPGSAYVSAAQIERFKAKYLTSGLVGREFGINSASARRILKQAGILPVVDPALLKTFVYLREDVLSVASVFAAQTLPAKDPNETCQTLDAGRTFDEDNKIGESDASIL
ncbi:TniQ family protein [Ascidiaceihabitans sp.]|uniref:TniQ family protein n=1 Tax=Ascidiaceihabitans sp. TaxID=1872644 RepID=UPI003297A510